MRIKKCSTLRILYPFLPNALKHTINQGLLRTLKSSIKPFFWNKNKLEKYSLKIYASNVIFYDIWDHCHLKTGKTPVMEC